MVRIQDGLGRSGHARKRGGVYIYKDGSLVASVTGSAGTTTYTL